MTDTTTDNMTPERFEELLDRHGSDLTRWPENTHVAAKAMLLASPAARSLHAQSVMLEQRLAGFEVPEPSPALRRRLLADFETQRSQRSWLEQLWLQLGGTRIAMPAMAAALALGIAVGSWLPSPIEADSDMGSDDALALLQYDLGDEIEW